MCRHCFFFYPRGSPQQGGRASRNPAAGHNGRCRCKNPKGKPNPTLRSSLQAPKPVLTPRLYPLLHTGPPPAPGRSPRMMRILRTRTGQTAVMIDRMPQITAGGSSATHTPGSLLKTTHGATNAVQAADVPALRRVAALAEVLELWRRTCTPK